MSAQATILAKYGQPGTAYQAKYCEVWHIQDDFAWFPSHSMLVNIDFKAKLFAAFTALQHAGIQSEIKTFDGCYNDRSVRGMNSTSLHAWAMAIDINAATEVLGQVHALWSAQFISIMKGAGLFWGGDFHNRKDPMHFGLFNG